MKKISGILLLLLLFASLFTAVSPVFAQEGADVSLAVTDGCATLDAVKPLGENKQLLNTAKAVILYELNTDTMVYSWHPDDKLDPSGMNKLMTAMLALENGDLAAQVTVSKEALSSVEIGSVSAGLKAGEQMTLQDLLYCMMVGSANDAAAVIAEYIGGSIPTFVGMMNSRAIELGCSGTQFMNPTGLSHEEQYTTARDLAKITAAALESEEFTQLFSAVSYTVPATNMTDTRQIVTTNHLMSKETVNNQLDKRVTGGKTGALTTRDRSLIATAQVDDIRYLSVVMSAEGTLTANGSVKTFGSLEETRELLDHGFGEFSVRQLLTDNKVMEQFPVSSGENDLVVRPSQTVSVMMPKDMEESEVSYLCKPLDGGIFAPVKKEQRVGTVEVWFRSVCVGSCDLLAMHDVNQPGVNNTPLSVGNHKGGTFDWTLILLIAGVVILGVVVLIGAVLGVIRLTAYAKVARRHRRRRKNRQRGRK